MRKINLLIAAFALTAVLGSCSGDEQKVKDFATDFGQKLSKSQIDSLANIYPDIATADSVALAFNPDSLKIEKTDTEGIYRIVFNGNASALVKKTDDGSFTVTETTGVFAYPAESMDFARKTGAVKGNLNDKMLAQVMGNMDALKSDLYDRYSKDHAGAIKKSGPVITRDIQFMMDEGRAYYTLTNTTDMPIAGDDYTVTWRHEYLGAFAPAASTKSEKGKDIPAHGSVKFPFSFSGHSSSELIKVTHKKLTKDEFLSSYKATGNEYDTFIKEHGDSKKDSAASSTASLGDGPYTIVGKINGKYPIHMTLNKGMRDGFYYYDKYGPSNKLTIKINEFDPATGKLSFEELTDTGEVTGVFNGTLTPETFIGEMEASSGKTFTFNLKVV